MVVRGAALYIKPNVKKCTLYTKVYKVLTRRTNPVPLPVCIGEFNVWFHNLRITLFNSFFVVYSFFCLNFEKRTKVGKYCKCDSIVVLFLYLFLTGLLSSTIVGRFVFEEKKNIVLYGAEKTHGCAYAASCTAKIVSNSTTL